MKLRYMLALIALIVLPLLLRRQSPLVKAAQRLRVAVAEAEAPVHVPGSGTREAEKFLTDLKAIDQSGASPSLRNALRDYIATVEANLAVRRTNGDVEASNYKVGEARKLFLKATDAERGQPF
jgi:hypothetical protein